jgi:hypothetical protein
MKLIIDLTDDDLSLFKMLKKIKELCNDGQTIPVIMNEGEMDEERINLDGDGDFYIKSIELKED